MQLAEWLRWALDLIPRVYNGPEDNVHEFYERPKVFQKGADKDSLRSSSTTTRSGIAKENK
jgi:hypothetical protein